MEARYAAGPTAMVYRDENGKKSRKKLIQLLWGDLIDLREEPAGDYVKVGVRIDEGTEIHNGWVKKRDIPKIWQELHEDTQRLLRIAGVV